MCRCARACACVKGERDDRGPGGTETSVADSTPFSFYYQIIHDKQHWRFPKVRGERAESGQSEGKERGERRESERERRRVEEGGGGHSQFYRDCNGNANMSVSLRMSPLHDPVFHVSSADRSGGP